MSIFTNTRQWLAQRIAPAARVQKRRFEAARLDRLTADWQATTVSINQELRGDLDRLRARCRQLTNNNDYARKFRLMCQSNIVGPGGIRLQARVQDGPGQPDRLANQAIEAAWSEWSAACDVTGRQSLRDLCETLVGQLPSDGEFLVRIVRGPQAGNRFGFALQAIDVDRIDTTHTMARAGNQNAVVMGVEIDQFHRPQAVWIFEAHPNDGAASSRQRIRLPIGEVLHVLKVERPEQARGAPWMAPGVLSLHHLGKFSLAALLAAENGANHFGFFQTPDGQSPIGAVDDQGETIAVTQPGTYDVLPPGVTFQAHESRYPDQAIGPFVKHHLQRIASGWGVAYHSLANDLENVNYSSIRSGTLEERDRWASEQEWFIASFLEPVFRAWLQYGLMAGTITMPNGSRLPAAKADKFSAHVWQARRWDWVDPKSDTEANILKVRAGLMSPQDLSAAMGYDFEDTLAAIRDAQNLAAEFGVRLTAYDATPGAGAPAAAAQDTAPADQASSARAPEPSSMALMADAMARALEASHQRAPQPVAVHVGIDRSQAEDMARGIADLHRASLEQIRTDVQNMPIVIPAPIVNVAAPQVSVQNVVEPAAVTLEATLPTPQITVSLPARRTDTSIERNAAGEIVRTTQLETDL
jgi:lambda family phage portal protein